jgi:agmatinase
MPTPYLMKPFSSIVLLVAVHVQVLRSGAHLQSPFTDAPSGSHRDSSETWSEKYGGVQYDLPFSGPLAFSHLPYVRCLENVSPAFDIALLGMPFDTSVTYRPGARFGPTGIRIGSRRIGGFGLRAWSLSWGLDPYQQGLEIIDCGDVSGRSRRPLGYTRTYLSVYGFSD